MSDILCPDCTAEIEVPSDAVLGEILSCPDCGLDLEVITIDGDKIKLERISIEKEDWGE